MYWSTFNVIKRNAHELKTVYLSLTVMSLIVINIFAGLLGSVSVGGEDVVLICRYSGSEEMYGMQLLSYNVSGYKDLYVGDYVVVSFNLRYVGIVKQIKLNKVFVGALLPNNTMVEFEDRSFRGAIISTGDVIRFRREIILTQNGTWVFWPAFEYYNGTTSSSPLVKSRQPWITCKVKVSERTPTPTPTTTPQPLPDLAFDPQYLQGITYSNCEGFTAYIKNIGRVPTNRDATARFTITSATGTTYVREVRIPPLAAGERTSISTGSFIGVPGRDYVVNVQLDFGNLIAESSELNNERSWTFTYRDWDLPQIDLELYNQVLSSENNGMLRFNVRNRGCLTSPPTTIHVGIEEGNMALEGVLWSGRVIELTSLPLSSMNIDEVKSFSIPGIINLIRSSRDPELQIIRYARIHVWVDPVSPEFQIEGTTVRIIERNEINNRKVVELGGAPTILGPGAYFIPMGQQTHTIDNPTNIWPTIGGATLTGATVNYAFSIQGCDATVSYQANLNRLTINIPRGCTSRVLTLTIVVESLGMRAQKDVWVYLYEVGSEVTLIQNALKPACKTEAELGASEAFIFTDLPVGIPYSPSALTMPVLWTIDVNTYENRRAVAEIEVSWIKPNGARGTYRLPSSNINKEGSLDNNPAVVFSIPRSAIFSDISTKAVRGNITLTITTGTQQRIERRIYPVWIHDSVTYPVYLRSFHFRNTPCPYIDWGMWERFWGEDAVWDRFCIFDWCWNLWHDWASDALYEYVFKEMCEEGRCSAHALVSQKFAEDPKPVHVVARCIQSSPQPFTIDKDFTVRMSEQPPSDSFRNLVMDLDTYLTYQYMWSLDERNLRRGTTALVRWLAGEDVVLETLNELRQWERMPPAQKWNDVPLLFMFADDIRNSHTVLVYRVEEVGANHVRVWVLDSNRPFQPNSAVNQDNSYVDFRCCRSDGRWYFTFYLDDARTKVIDAFLFATGSSLFHGESAAVTTGDVIFGLFDLFIEYLKTLGYAESSEDSNVSNRTPALVVVGGDAGIKLGNVSDVKGKKVFTFNGMAPPSRNDMSSTAVAIPIPAPMTNPVYVFITGSELNLDIKSTENGTVRVVAEDGNRSLSIQYLGSPGRTVNLILNQSRVKIKNSGSGSYRVASSTIDQNLARQIFLEVESTRYNLDVDFLSGEGFIIKNAGDKPLNISVELVAHNGRSRQNALYTGITVSPGDTVAVSPQSWDNVSAGHLLVRVDMGSDGRIDEERTIDTSGGIVVTAPSTTTVSITSTTTITEKATTTATVTTSVLLPTASAITVTTITVTTTVHPERPSELISWQLLMTIALAVVVVVAATFFIVRRSRALH